MRNSGRKNIWLRRGLVFILVSALAMGYVLHSGVYAVDTEEATTQTQTTEAPQSTQTQPEGAAAPTDTATVCEFCAAENCLLSHSNWCILCKAEDCGKSHVTCDTCGVTDAHAADCAARISREAELSGETPNPYTNAAPLIPVAVAAQPAVTTFDLGGSASGSTVENGLILSKTAEYDETKKSASIRLEAYVTGTVTTETIEKNIPCDIVLALDFSGSMLDSMGTDNVTRSDALKNAVNRFIDAIHEKYDASSADHRISLVTFSGAEAAVQNDWTDVSDANVEELKITDPEIEGWRDKGTPVNFGMDMAYDQLLELEADGELRCKAVVLFTDGEMSYYRAVDSVNKARQMKAMGCAVYTVATSALADVTGDLRLAEGIILQEEDSQEKFDARYINAVMHSISSNYPEMTAEQTGTAEQIKLSNIAINSEVDANGNYKIDDGEPSYYLVADTSDSLNTIFQSIASNIQSGAASMELGSGTAVKDIVSDYFDLPADPADVIVRTYDCTAYDPQTGEAKWSEEGGVSGATVTFDTENKTVNVTGFDFSKNFISESGRDENDTSKTGDFHGRKLVIIFSAPVREGFLGGNSVPTNGSATGVYSGGTMIEAFAQPVVDVPVKAPTVSAPDYNVYLFGGKTDEQLKAGTTVSAGGQTVSLDPSAINYGLQSWQNAYVSISVDAMSGFSSLTADAAYTAKVVFTPINSGTYKATSGTDTGSINVYKPVVTYRDSTVTLGDRADYETQNYIGVRWMHGAAEAPSDMGEAPALTYTYDPTEAQFREDTPVKATVKLGTADVTGYTTFYRSPCTYDGCSNQEQTAVSGANENRVNFVVHVPRYDLTISKKVEGLPEDKIPQSFTFKVVDAKNEEHIVTVSNGGFATVTVPAGAVTVTEMKINVDGYDLTVDANGTDVTNGTGAATEAYPIGNGSAAVFTNTYTRKTTGVTVGKMVSGNMGSRSEAFSFTVTVRDADNSILPFIHNGKTVNSATFSLKHGESTVLTDIPVGAVVTVREVPGDYITSAEVNNTSVAVTEGSLTFSVLDTEADSVLVINSKSATVDTGIVLDSWPYVLILVGVIVAGVILFVGKRRIEDEDL